MKFLSASIVIILITSTAFSSPSGITCGIQPGEIYFSGFHRTIWGEVGFYYSDDYGENIELRNYIDYTVSSIFGFFEHEPIDSTIHSFRNEHLMTTDGGYEWRTIDPTSDWWDSYAAGVLPGEVYRRQDEDGSKLERSTDYGESYIPCTSNGDQSSIRATALGVNPGEVYIWTYYGVLYYSDDYAENFTCLGDLHSLYGINLETVLINGAETGEIYIFCEGNIGRIWRVSDFGSNVELLIDEPIGPEYNHHHLATSSVPGELYLLGNWFSIFPGGISVIYHTTDYFQTWEVFEHYVNVSSTEPQVELIPENSKFKIFPNPGNPSFTIQYELDRTQPVEFQLFDILGRQVWQDYRGIQPPGLYEFSHTGENLSSGAYLLQMQTDNGGWSKKVIILK